MSHIALSQSHTKSIDELRTLIEQMAVKMEQRYQLVSHWQGEREIQLERSGVHGSIVIDEDEVQVTIRLGLLMSPFKHRIRDEVAKALREKLA